MSCPVPAHPPVLALLFCATLVADVLSQTPARQADTRPSGPLTVAEQSNYVHTSKFADVVAFLDKLKALPQANRLRRLTMGKTTEGKELPLVIVSNPPLKDDTAVMKSNKLRLLVNGNIHAGEVEGKEACLILLRELASGRHGELLEHAILMFVPIYNADGNDKMSPRNRRGQNGPTGGVGRRPNSQGYDLNRDFVKVEAPETRGQYWIWNRFDPHLFMDLHTTNGSAHGYHLTYAPSLATNCDPGLRDFCKQTLLPEVRKKTKDIHGFRVFDYGNTSWRSGGGRRGGGRGRRGGGRGRRGGQRGGQRGGERRPQEPQGPPIWRTYDHRPRFGTNCFGLRNRIAVLSEAYSYVAFKDRIAVTRAFVLETLRAAVRHRDKVRELCAAADKRVQEGGLKFGHSTTLEPPRPGEVLWGELIRERGEYNTRTVATGKTELRKAQLQIAYVSRKFVELPTAWAMTKPPAKVLEALKHLGVRFQKLEAPRKVQAEVFVPTDVRKRSRVFQKHYEVTLTGEYQKREVELPAGSIWVPANQRLGRLAAQALEAVSEDSLATWNYFDEQLQKTDGGKYPDYPVVRVMARREQR